ncbi:DegT/DnrJ/EryC1/StrS family aminotransferase [Synechococcus sp. Tobar12-5m-g]|uniref:DegT/DnrJ/EryC1/StrS family aminotransferase n=1 Tax=unclassified Synechococcus TaxID=2626047 RepID=UPI0020CF6330|nr:MULTISPECIES: DegT/DnrJ/EryC1/StrS family aminotransferase [unclassified Synechococcus]MCP9772594.1 DegT/DnrJ/EryC1/StrS family aminotransferase [Synechococcus sp. Tobar12-5m-g]MCP9873550.1 DegT/DnrJ/EryC1/StrS family aminotransferase [Synechococcus sp. Cruz CV-v-12]
MKEEIHVTKPFLPPLQDLEPYLSRIWASHILTNNGPLCQELEEKLQHELGARHALLVCNATLGLAVALKALKVSGEVITSPFSFVATTQAILLAGCKPVFADIDPTTFGLDPEDVARKVTSATRAIMPTHVYGIPCDVEGLQNLAEEHQLKLIYDAAHCFKADCHCGTFFGHGDASVISLHATKLYNTFEGGVILTNNSELAQICRLTRNFGFAGEDTVIEDGLNAKMSELHAAVGLAGLPHIGEILAARKKIAHMYLSGLEDVKSISLLMANEVKRSSFGYFPIAFKAGEISRERIVRELRKDKIYARRYFYPLIPEHKPYQHYLNGTDSRRLFPCSWNASRSVLCLPIYPGQETSVIERTCEIIRNAA